MSWAGKKPGWRIRFNGKIGAPGAATNLLTSDDTPARSGGLGAPHLLNFHSAFAPFAYDPKGDEQENAKEELSIPYFVQSRHFIFSVAPLKREVRRGFSVVCVTHLLFETVSTLYDTCFQSAN